MKPHSPTLAFLVRFSVTLLFSLLAIAAAAPNASAGTTERVSLSSTGAEASAESSSPALSDSGRFVAFNSSAPDLVPGDTNNDTDVFVRNRLNGTTERVSVGSRGVEGLNGGANPSISADGRFVSFASGSDNLVPNDTNGACDIFVRDRQTDFTERASVASDGTQADGFGACGASSISADGRFVAFVSESTNLIPSDLNGRADVFVHDLETGATERISSASDGTQGNDHAGFWLDISSDGRVVVFLSAASNLVAGDTNGATDAFVHDRQTGTTERVSVAADGSQADGPTDTPSISADGSAVSFTSGASNLVPGDTNGRVDVFVRDRQADTTERVDVSPDGGQVEGAAGGSISGDGKYVAFEAGDDVLPSDTDNGWEDIFVHDRQTGTTERVSIANDGTQQLGHSSAPVVSPDGRVVGFASEASNLVPSDTNGVTDVFVRDSSASPQPGSYVALGDSYSSGFGVGDYEPGTHKDGTVHPENDCQRSAAAFGPVVAEALGVPLVFKACNGAVTHDLLSPRAGSWGESAQFDYLGPDVGLLTFSIGGNDVDFAKHLEECILGFELLPFNTCSGDKKVTAPVQEALERLGGRRATPAQTVPYNEIFKKARERTPSASRATRIAVGYPEFFTKQGQPGYIPDRCNGVKVVDQQWTVHQIERINSIVEATALRNGFRFIDPSPYFDGHELCSGGEEWVFPLLYPGTLLKHPGAFHPTAAGQHAIAQAILDTLDETPEPPGPTFMIASGETILHQFAVPAGKSHLTISTEWPGSDVLTSLTSPSGQLYTRSDPGPSSYHGNGSTWEQFEISNPESGEWLVELYGADVSAEGEPVSLSTQVENAPNIQPTANIAYIRDGDRLLFDASQSTDVDGQISSYDWYVTSATAESTATGPTLTLAAELAEGRTVTLVATDDQEATAFASVTFPATSNTEQQASSAIPAFSETDQLPPMLRGVRLQVWTGRGWRNTRVIETGALHHGRVAEIGKRVRLVLRLSEDAQLRLQMHLAGKRKVRQGRLAWTLRAGVHRLSVTKLLRHTRPSRYQLTLTAIDQARNEREYNLGMLLR